MGLFGSNSTPVTKLAGIQVQTSLLGQGITIGYGRARVSCNLVDYVGFKATPQSNGVGKGGTATSYNYSSSVVMVICEGPIVSVPTVYKDSSVYTDGGGTTAMARAGLNLQLGTLTQAPWGYLTSVYPDHAIGYSTLAYVYAQDYDLGSGATLANHAFEVNFPIQFGPNGDADAADIIKDYYTSSSYGIAGWTTSLFGDWSDYSLHNRAHNLLISTVIDGTSSTTAADVTKNIMLITNSEVFFSEGVLKVKPYSDETVTGNGVTWTPNLTPVVNLTEDDFLTEVQLEIKDQNDAKNYCQVEYLDRANQYQPAIAIAQDLDDIITFGLRKNDAEQFHDICDKSIAQLVVQLRLQRILYVRDTYHFKVPEDFAFLDPMDYITLTTTVDGMKLDRQLVLIKEISEDDNNDLDIVAEGVPGSTASAALYTATNSSGYQPQVDCDPGNVNSPVLFIPPAGLLTVDGEAWLAVAGLSANWGGCDVYISADNMSYKYVGSCQGPARYGVLTSSLPLVADPDNTSTPGVDLSASLGSLATVTAAERDTGGTLSLINGELIGYEDATLTSANHYTLSLLRRGLYGTAPAAHTTGSTFVRLDNSIFKFSYKGLNVGNTIYVKLASFNIYGRNPQDISTLGYYTLTLGALPGIQATSVAPGVVVSSSLATGAVTSPSLSPNSVTNSYQSTPSTTYSGSGAYVSIASVSLTLTQAGQLDIFGSIAQGYTGAIKDWGLRIKVNGTVVAEYAYGSGRSSYLETVSINKVGYVASSGPYTISLEWAGTDSTISASNINLSVVRRYA